MPSSRTCCTDCPPPAVTVNGLVDALVSVQTLLRAVLKLCRVYQAMPQRGRFSAQKITRPKLSTKLTVRRVTSPQHYAELYTSKQSSHELAFRATCRLLNMRMHCNHATFNGLTPEVCSAS